MASLMQQLTDYAVSIGYSVAVQDLSEDPDLVFLLGEEGSTYSLSVQRIDSEVD